MTNTSKNNQFSKLKALETYLRGKYTFRYNTVLESLEYSEVGKGDYKEVNIYNILYAVRSEGKISTSKSYLKQFLSDEYIAPLCNPLKEWIASIEIPKSNPFVNLTDLVELEDANEKNRLMQSLENWFISSVKFIYDKNPVPTQIIVFQGASFVDRISFLKSFLPAEMFLYQTVYCGKSPSKENLKEDLARCAIIIFDEIDDFFRLKSNYMSFRSIEQLSQFTIGRVPRTRRLKVRMASFLATCQDSSFLKEVKRPHRYEVFRVKKIWYSVNLAEAGTKNKVSVEKFDMYACWAWALKQYKQGVSPNYSPEELVRNEWRNEKYTYCTPEFNAIREFFEPSTKEDGEFMTSTEVMEYINKAQAETQFHNVINIGKALVRLKYERKCKNINGRPRWGYWVKKLQPTKHKNHGKKNKNLPNQK